MTKQLMATATIIKKKLTREKTMPGRFGIYGGRYAPETLMAAYRMAGIFNFEIPSPRWKGRDDARREAQLGR